jgi:hypothetical protein
VFIPKKGDPDPVEQDPYWSDMQKRIGSKRQEPDRVAVETAEKRLDAMMDRAFSTLEFTRQESRGRARRSGPQPEYELSRV